MYKSCGTNVIRLDVWRNELRETLTGDINVSCNQDSRQSDSKSWSWWSSWTVIFLRFNGSTQGIINNYLHVTISIHYVSKSKKIFPKLSIDTISHQTGTKILSEIEQINKTGTKCDAGLIISFLTSCLTIFFQSKWSVITKILLWIGQLCSLHYLYDIYKCDLIFQPQPKFQVEAMFNYCQFSRDNVKCR